MSGRYAYAAVDAAGRRVRGQEPAANEAALTRQLTERGMVVLEVREARGAADAGGGGRRAVLDATRSIAALLGAGLPLARSLRITAELGSPALRAVLTEVLSRIEGGDSLAGALAAHPRHFKPLYVGIVRAGERSGALADAFQRLSTHLEQEEELRSRLLSAMIYPLILASAGGLAVLLLVIVVLPQFVELLEGSGTALPASTAALLEISSLLRTAWPILLPAFLLLAAGVAAALRSEGGRRAASATLLAIPGVRGLRQAVLGAHFSRLMGILLSGGATMPEALADAEKSLHDPLARDAAGRIGRKIREGVSVTEAVHQEPIFPPMLARLVAVGEESGRLSEFLLKAAEVLETTAERAVRRLVTFAEPAMIVLFGGVVAFVALSLLQAIYGVNADAFK
ncbi:MAG TPA: type II secretion system F family protein [Longimicrobium sp.]